MYKKTPYMGANDYVEMTEGLDSSMLASLGNRRRRRVLTTIVTVLLLFVGCAWSASRPAAFRWVSRMAPPVAQLLRPNALGQEEGGIRLEVAETTREGDELVIHLTMEDLEADRLSGEASPGWWEYRQGPHQATGATLPEYDPGTGLLHLYLTCTPTEAMPDLDWERWITVTIHDLHTAHGSIEADWTIHVSPLFQ